MISYYLDLIQTIIISQILINNTETRFAISLLLIIILMLYYPTYKRFNTPLTLEKLKIINKFDIFMIILHFVFYFCIYLGPLFYFRVNAFGKILDLKLYFVNFLQLAKNLSYLQIFLNIFAIVIFILCFIILFTKIRKGLFKNFLKLHFLIISKLKMNWLEETWYDKIRFQIYQKLYLNIILFPVNVLRFIKKIFNRCNEKQYDVSDNILASYYKFYGFFLAFFFIIYDIFINNFVLMKIYYLLPFLLFYHLLLLFVDLHGTFLQDDEYDIACFLYVKLVESTEDQLIYVNGHITSKENLDKIEHLFKNNFDYTKIK